ncbi:MAG: glycosyltransferase family 2 protein [Bacteroidaceae bacterium]|nr:glycosyltransferase family 2 protein [Bacteroidaceae bacterium]
MRLSVIIPCYNVADTLQRCVQSILMQLPDDSEILLVDDGSTDATGALADALGAEQEPVRVFHKTNGGLSDARNYGIGQSSGEYLMFVDSDDELAPSTIPSVLSYMLQHSQVDVAEFPVRVHYGHESEYLQDFSDEIWSSARKYWLKTEAWEHTYAWNKIYKRQLLQETRFPKGRLFEDIWFWSELLSKQPKVATLSCGLYLYYWNERGITVNADANALQQQLEGLIRAAKLMKTSLFSVHGWRLYRSMMCRQMDICNLSGSPKVKILPCYLHIVVMALYKGNALLRKALQVLRLQQ